jgi:hypothetical protein
MPMGMPQGMPPMGMPQGMPQMDMAQMGLMNGGNNSKKNKYYLSKEKPKDFFF